MFGDEIVLATIDRGERPVCAASTVRQVSPNSRIFR